MTGKPRQPLPLSHPEAEALARELVGSVRLTEAESRALEMLLELVEQHEPPTRWCDPTADE